MIVFFFNIKLYCMAIKKWHKIKKNCCMKWTLIKLHQWEKWGKPAPSSMPCPLLHFTLDPRKQRFVARKIAKAILARTHPITSECDFSHFIAIWSHKRFIMCCASWPTTPSTDYKGCKLMKRVYIFNSCWVFLPEHSTCMQQHRYRQCDYSIRLGVSVYDMNI